MTHPVLKKTRTIPSVGFDIATILGHVKVPGQIGIEIECEGNKFPKHAYGPNPPVDADRIPPQWKYHKDGSLRGADNAEYVFAKPMMFDEVRPAVEALYKMFKDYGTVLDDSNRTSVHVHLNMQPFYLDRFATFCALFLCVEEILVEWCGNHRVGNLFCLRAKDAPAIVTKLKNFINRDGEDRLSDGLHYANLNAQALQKFGSVEIRAMRGTDNPETILTWVGILRRIYELSGELNDPRKVCEMFSSEGPLSFYEWVLGAEGGRVLHDIGWTPDRARDALYDGIRLAQDICYCRDWDLYKKTEVKDDPFGRDPRKIAKKVAASQSLGVETDSWSVAPAPIGNSLAEFVAQYQSSIEEIDPEYEPDIDFWEED